MDGGGIPHGREPAHPTGARHLLSASGVIFISIDDTKQANLIGRPRDIRGKIVQINGEDYWIETDWLRKKFGKYGTCPYEEIEKWYNSEKEQKSMRVNIYS